jgi:hypothetical protein
MRLFLKYASIGLGVQIVLLLLLGVIGNLISPAVNSLFELLLRIYEPMIVFIAKVGKFEGESAMIEPVWMGISIGVVLYSLLLGFAASVLTRRR